MTGAMARLFCLLTACLAVSCAVALAEPAPRGPEAAQAAARPHRPAARLTVAAATKPIRQFLTSATQVTALPGAFRIGTCRRRSPRVLDCPFAIPGRSTGTMRAKLMSGSRVQLYVLGAAAS